MTNVDRDYEPVAAETYNQSAAWRNWTRGGLITLGYRIEAGRRNGIGRSVRYEEPGVGRATWTLGGVR